MARISNAGLPAMTRLMAARAFSRDFSDAHEVDWADGGPDLLAAGVAGDGNEALGAARLNANVMAGELGVGVGVAGRARFEGADAGVGQGLSHGSKRGLGLTVG